MASKSEGRPQRKSKGKRHELHARSFEELATKLEVAADQPLTRGDLAQLLKEEAKRVKSILR